MISLPPSIADRLREIQAEAESLCIGMQFSHFVSNDVQAIGFMMKLNDAGYSIQVEDAEACLQRLQITERTGRYPADLLSN